MRKKARNPPPTPTFLLSASKPHQAFPDLRRQPLHLMRSLHRLVAMAPHAPHQPAEDLLLGAVVHQDLRRQAIRGGYP